MAERVLGLGEERRLVEEARALEPIQHRVLRVLGEIRDVAQHGEEHVLADDRRGLQHVLVLRGQPIDARRDQGLHRRGDLEAVHRSRRTVGATLPREEARLHEGPHALLEEERVAVRALDEEPLHRAQLRALPEHRAQHLGRALRPQRLEAELGVVGLVAPGVLVLRAVVEEDEDRRRGQARDEAVDDGLALRVHPVEILEGEDDRPRLALAQEDRLDRVGRRGPALGLREPVPGRVAGGHVEQGQQRGEDRPQGLVQREQPARHLLPHLAGVVARLDAEVGPREIDHRRVGRPLAVGDRGGLDDEGALEAVGMDELPEQAGLADPGLADHRDHLAVAAAARSRSSRGAGRARLGARRSG